VYGLVGAIALCRPCHCYNRYTGDRVSPLRVLKHRLCQHLGDYRASGGARPYGF